MAQVAAVLPAAGLGTRLRPLTQHIPKELLPVGRLPVIGHVLRELREVGVEAGTIVISPSKTSIRDYCGDGSTFGLQCTYVVQEVMRGVGDAVLCAVTSGVSAPVLVAFADCAILPRRGSEATSGTKRLVEAFHEHGAEAAVLCEEVPRERTRHYGVLAPAPGSDPSRGMPFELAGIVEKPDPATAPSCFVVAARWILGGAAIEAIRRQAPGPNGEVGITEAIAALIRAGGKVVAVPLGADERRCDVGNIRSYLSAQAFAALHDPEYGGEVATWLETELRLGRRGGV